jgi:hypothetical protein
MYGMYFMKCLPKQPNLELKTWPKQLLGSLLSHDSYDMGLTSAVGKKLVCFKQNAINIFISTMEM